MISLGLIELTATEQLKPIRLFSLSRDFWRCNVTGAGKGQAIGQAVHVQVVASWKSIWKKFLQKGLGRRNLLQKLWGWEL